MPGLYLLKRDVVESTQELNSHLMYDKELHLAFKNCTRPDQHKESATKKLV